MGKTQHFSIALASMLAILAAKRQNRLILQAVAVLVKIETVLKYLNT